MSMSKKKQYDQGMKNTMSEYMENHICQQRTGTWGYNSHKPTKIKNKKKNWFDGRQY